MDRKAWIVITLCAVGMALNYFFAVQNQQAFAAQQAEAAKNAPPAAGHIHAVLLPAQLARGDPP
ncbi:MAG TPA: hypothetical protein PK490_23690, partial [Prosthecobacter sp.]|nr:hypothetical protein [Prosthecobacter sp.]